MITGGSTAGRTVRRKRSAIRLAVTSCSFTAVPTVRLTSERAAARSGGTLIRINTREPQTPAGHIAIAAPALETLKAINERLDAQ